MKKIVIAASMVTTVCLLLSILSCAPAAKPPTEVKILKIGSMGPQSGAAAAWGLESFNILTLKLEEINNAGGLKVGNDVYQIKIFSYDTKARADEATTVAKKLIYDNGVKVIVGNYVSATTDAAQLVTEPNKVIFIFNAWGIKNLGPDKPYSFRTCISFTECAPAFFKYIHEISPKVKTIVLLTTNDTTGYSGKEAIELACAALGIKVVTEFYDRGIADFGPIVTRVLSHKPDAIELSQPPGDAGMTAKVLRERNYEGLRTMVPGLNPYDIAKIAGEAAEGMYYALSWNFEGEYATESMRDLSKRYTARFKVPLTLPAAADYASAGIVFEAMQRAGTVDDTDKIMKAMEGKFDTVLGRLQAGGKDIYGIDRQFLFPFVVSQWQGGKIVELKRLTPFTIKK